MRAIEEIAERIAQRFDVERIILFGSYAYGRPERRSDVDMLVVMNTTKRPFKHTLEIIDALSPMHFGIDFIVRSHREIKRRAERGDFFFQEIIDRGRVLYDKQAT